MFFFTLDVLCGEKRDFLGGYVPGCWTFLGGGEGGGGYLGRISEGEM